MPGVSFVSSRLHLATNQPTNQPRDPGDPRFVSAAKFGVSKPDLGALKDLDIFVVEMLPVIPSGKLR